MSVRSQLKPPAPRAADMLMPTRVYGWGARCVFRPNDRSGREPCAVYSCRSDARDVLVLWDTLATIAWSECSAADAAGMGDA